MIHYINKQLQFIIIQDLHSLRNGSLDYASMDPTYRVCVEETKKQGTTYMNFIYSTKKFCGNLKITQNSNFRIQNNKLCLSIFLGQVKLLCVDDNSRRCSEDPRSPPPTLIVQEYFGENKINNNNHDEKENPFFPKKSSTAQDFYNLESTTENNQVINSSEITDVMSPGAIFMNDLSKHVSKITGLDPEMIPSTNNSNNPKHGKLKYMTTKMQFWE